MDPTQTLADLLAAIDSEDRDTAAECALALGDWLATGGFYPELSRAIARALPDRPSLARFTEETPPREPDPPPTTLRSRF